MIIAAPFVAVGHDGLDRRPVVPRHMLPSETGLVELHAGQVNDLSRYHELDYEERAIVSAAVDSRKAEFGDGRWCAHRALRGLGEDVPILRGPKGMPLFPPTVSGTISHTRGLRMALVGRSEHWQSLGLDVEVAQRLPEGVLTAVTSVRERRVLRRVGSRVPGRELGTVLFSAKESVYKAWYPLAGRFLDFDEVDMHLEITELGDGPGDEISGTWHARVLSRPSPVPALHGTWVIRDGYVVTVCGVQER